MVVVSLLASIVKKVYYFFRYCVDTVLYIVTVVLSAALMVLNLALSLFIILEEFTVFCLILPWIPTKSLGSLITFLRSWGFPKRIHFLLYVGLGVLFLTFYIISLELHYLQVNESLLNNFDEFRSSLLTSVKYFVVIHRFFDLFSNESSLRNTCNLLRKRLKFEQNEELDAKQLAEGLDDDLEIESLRYELEKTKLELESMRISYTRLQQQQENAED